MIRHPTVPSRVGLRSLFANAALVATLCILSCPIVEQAVAQAENDYLQSLRSDTTLRKLDGENHLPVYYGIEDPNSGTSRSRIHDFLRVCKIKTPRQVCDLVRERYPDVAGAKLHSYEIVRTTGLYFVGPRIGEKNPDYPLAYAWCVSIMRLDGKTRHPRVTNRVWVNPFDGTMLSMLTAEATIAQADPTFPSEVYTEDLLPVLTQRRSMNDPKHLTRKLRQSKIPTQVHVKKLLQSKGLGSVMSPGGAGRGGIASVFELGCSVKDFGKDGDLVWVVQQYGVFALKTEVWVNSRTEKIRTTDLSNGRVALSKE